MFYYPIYLDASDYNKINSGLYRIISEIGRFKVELKPGQSESMEQHFTNGLNYLNKRLNKCHKTAINHLVFAERCVCNYDEINRTIKYRWKFHRTKAVSILQLIHQLLESMNRNEISKLFSEVQKLLTKYGVLQRGDYIIGFPYYTTVQQQAKNEKNKSQRKKTLSNIVKSIDSFSTLYDPYNPKIIRREP